MFIQIAKMMPSLRSIKSLFNQIKKPEKERFDLPTIEQGSSIPILFGTRLLKEPVIAWYGNENIYSYDNVTYVHLGVHFILSRGYCDFLYRVKVGDETLDGFPKLFGGESPTYDKKSLFGGWQEEGGISGTFDMISAGQVASPNSYLQSVLGANIPNFKGVSSVVLKQMYLGTSLQQKPWAFKARRLVNSTSGIYAYQAIPNPNLQILISAGLNGDQAGADYASAVETRIYTGLQYAHVFISKRIDATYKAWSPDGGTTWTNAFTIRDLSTAVETTYWPETYATADEAQNALSNAILTGVPFSPADPSLGFAIYLKDTDGNISLNSGSLQYSVNEYPIFDVNPACILWETLTDTEWGLSLLPSFDIDPTTFINAASTLYDERFGISIVWNDESTGWDFVDIILKHIEGVLYFDRTDGLLKLKLIREDYDVNDITLFNESNSSNLVLSRESYEDLVNSVTVKYHDNSYDQDSSVTVQNSAIILNQGIEIGKTFEFMGLTNAETASVAALRELNVLSQAFWKGSVIVSSDGENLNLGDAILVSNDLYKLDNVPFRVVGVNLGDPLSSDVKLNIVQDVFTTSETSLVGNNDSVWQPIDNVAQDAEAITVFESPYWLWIAYEGLATVNTDLLDNSAKGIVVASAGRPTTSSLNARLAVGNVSYIEYGNLDFNPWTTILSTLSETSASFTEWGGFDTDLLAEGDLLFIESEIMQVSSIGATIGIYRGCLDTLPTSHDAGTKVLVFKTGVTNFVRYLDGGSNVNAKLLTTTLSDALTQSEAFTSTVVMDSRAIRPYPPGKFLVNTTPFGATIGSGDDLALSWAHRNRENLTVIDQDAASVTIESGTTYTLRIYDELDVLARTETGLTGETYTYTQTNELSDTGRVNSSLRVELESVRDGFTSSQKYNHTITRV